MYSVFCRLHLQYCLPVYIVTNNMNIGISRPILKIMEVINTFITFFQTHFSQMNDLSLEVKLHLFLHDFQNYPENV